MHPQDEAEEQKSGAASPGGPGGRIGGLGRLIVDAFVAGAGCVEEIHGAVAARAFAAAGPEMLPAKLLHDDIAWATYRAAGGLGTAAGGATAALERAVSDDPGAVFDTAKGSAALAALNGAVGDHLERGGSALALPMAIRLAGADVAVDRAALSRAFDDATPRLVVFVHGLGESELAWGFGGDAPYGARLRRDLACTPVYLRYNSGLHVSENGRRLRDLLDALTACWPSEIEQIALVGHSMGGLVARSACHYGHLAGSEWIPHVRHVVCLGSPHFGAPLEKAANVVGWSLDALPETRPLARVLNARSEGIKDLRYGALLDEDWLDRDPDALLEDVCHDVPFLAGATYCFVAATVTRDARHPLGQLVGDLLVRYPNAGGGHGRRASLPLDHNRHVGGRTHFHLLNDPAIYAQLRTWLADAATASPT